MGLNKNNNSAYSPVSDPVVEVGIVVVVIVIVVGVVDVTFTPDRC